MDFERALDEFFDEMLISRWRRSIDRDEFDRAEIVDHEDRYEVRIAIPGAHADRIEVDVSGQRLTVRAPTGPNGIFESSYSFSIPINGEAASARLANETLVVTVPKQKPKRIKVNG